MSEKQLPTAMQRESTRFVGAVRRTMQARGISANTVARQTGLSGTGLRKALRLDHNITLETMCRICDAVGLRLRITLEEP